MASRNSMIVMTPLEPNKQAPTAHVVALKNHSSTRNNEKKPKQKKKNYKK